MPKIPLYNKGVGPTVEIATGRLSPQVSAEALTAPARQMARLGEQVGQAGRQFAENQIAYQKQKAQVDFQFKKAEQDRESVRIGNQLVREFRDLSDNHILSTQQKHTNTTSASDDFDATITQSAIKRIDELEVTDRQREGIRTSVLNSLSPYASAAKKNAYNHGLTVFKAEHDESVQTTIDNISVDATAEELATYVTDLQQKSTEAIANGATPKIAPELVPAVVAEAYVDKRIVAATSTSEIDQITSAIEDAPISQSVKRRLRNTANVRRTAIQKEVNDGIIADINMLDPNLIGQQNFADATAAIRAGATQVTLFAETPTEDGKLVQAYQIDLTGADASMVSRTISALNGLQSVAESEANTSVIDSVRTALPDMSLPEINRQLELARRGEGFGAGLKGTALSSIIGVFDAEVGRREVQVLTTIQQNKKDITASITANNGQRTPEMQALISETSDLYGSVGREAEASAFVAEVAAIQKAGQIFSGVQFGTDEEIRAAVVAQTAAGRDAPVEQAAEEQATLKALTDMITARENAMSVDPVGYLEREKGPLSVPERINLQRQMGKPEVEIRLASTAEIKAFKDEYGFAENYAEKSRIGNEFIARFGAGNETMVIRNLMNQGVISVVDNLVIANPDNSYMFDVEAANAPSSVDSFKDRLTKDQRDSTTTAVRAELEEYSNSIIGGGFDDVLSRTATDKRAAHVFAMSDIVQNTAMYYQSISSISPEEAAKKAAAAVIGSQYTFISVNNNQVRLKKGMEGVSQQLGTFLQGTLSEAGRSYLAETVETPNKVGIESAITDEEYISDLISKGRWVTTTDNSGVYLVDQTGNMVRRKSIGPVGFPKDEFIIIPFSNIMGEIRELQALDEIYPLAPEKRSRMEREIITRRKF